MMTPSPHILIIDDDFSFCSVLARTLESRGFHTATAHDPKIALAEAERVAPSHVVLDLNLAGQSGLNLIAPLRAQCPKARIVVLTGYASIPTAVSALRLGAQHYLPKPARTADLLQALFEDNIPVPTYHSGPRLSVSLQEWEYIQRALAEHQGNISATARALNMHRRTLQRKLNKKRPTD